MNPLQELYTWTVDFVTRGYDLDSTHAKIVALLFLILISFLIIGIYYFFSQLR